MARHTVSTELINVPGSEHDREQRSPIRPCTVELSLWSCIIIYIVPLLRLSQNSIVTNDGSWLYMLLRAGSLGGFPLLPPHVQAIFPLYFEKDICPFLVLLKYSYAITLKIMTNHKFSVNEPIRLHIRARTIT